MADAFLDRASTPEEPEGDPSGQDAAALRRELAERDDLLALLTHELRNPLHVLKLQLELAHHSAEAGDLADTRRKIDKTRLLLRRYAKRATLMLDLMGRRDGYPVHMRETDLGALLADLAEGLRLEAGFHRMALTCDLPPQPITHATDPQALEQIVENLLLNAFKHSNGTLVRLALHTGRDGGPQIEITDNGRGIPEQDLARLCRKHEVGQAGRGAAGQAGGHTHGTGLGLWIVQRLVAVLGASLALESKAGQGCRFTVVLPSMPSSPQ